MPHLFVHRRETREGDCGPGIWVYEHNPVRTLVDTGALDAWPLSDSDREVIRQQDRQLLAEVEIDIALRQGAASHV